jgi:hypothetical protein
MVHVALRTKATEVFVVTHRPQTESRFRIPDPVASALSDLVTASEVAVIVDVDALERSRYARIDDEMLLTLDALMRARIQVALLSGIGWERARWLHHRLPESWHFEGMVPMFAIADVRTRIPGVRIIAATDQEAICTALAAPDRGLLLSAAALLSIPSNSRMIGDVGLRAALWWLVDERTRREK